MDARRTLFVLDGEHPSLPRIGAIDACAPVPSLEMACAEQGAAPADVLTDVESLSDATPEAPFPHLLRARFELACRNDPAAATAHIDAAIAAPSRDPEAFRLRATARAMAGDMSAALDAADRAVAYDLSWSSRVLRARMRLSANDPEGAIDDLTEMLSELGDDMPASARLVLARALARTNRKEEAIAHARRALLSGGGPAAAALLEELGAPPWP
jgi:tetratricopeptide (TPR) repeat protein